MNVSQHDMEQKDGTCQQKKYTIPNADMNTKLFV